MLDNDPTTGRYIQSDPLGLVDGVSVYGYALQNLGGYVDPTGEFIPIAVVIGLSVGTWIAGEILEDQYEKCGCGESDAGDQAAAVGLGGMVFWKNHRLSSEANFRNHVVRRNKHLEFNNRYEIKTGSELRSKGRKKTPMCWRSRSWLQCLQVCRVSS